MCMQRLMYTTVPSSGFFLNCPIVGYLYHIKRLKVAFSQSARSLCAEMLIAPDLQLESHAGGREDINYTSFYCRL